MINKTKANEFKEKGNEAFKLQDYKAAINYYSQAISEDNTQSIYFSNRAKAYKNIKMLDEAYKDALSAVELDDKNIKAHLISGQVLCETGKVGDNKKIELAITRLTKARTLCAGQKKQEYEKELDIYLYKAQKLLWMKKNEEDQKKNQHLIEQLKSLVMEDSVLSEQEKETTQKQIDKYITKKEFKYEIPDYFLCCLTKKFMLDPVTTQTGYSYERQPLMDHFKTNGYIDPQTNENINPNILYSNVNLRQAAEDFVKRNPWAFQYKEGETYMELEF